MPFVKDPVHVSLDHYLGINTLNTFNTLKYKQGLVNEVTDRYVS